MNWEHECSLAWLKSRRHHLTASEIKKLIPLTATGRPRTVTDFDRMKVMANKFAMLTEEDCMSYGAAARGHIMEPYAIDSLNAMLKEMGINEYFHWWDDELVTVDGRSLAFSPDAMDVKYVDDIEFATAIAEVKSYSNEKHIAVAYTPKERIEERWQIAVPMALYPNIDHGYLVLFNPKMMLQRLFLIKYDRSELQKEIETILQVEEEWDDFSERMLSRPTSGAVWYSKTPTEEEIIKLEMDKHHSLNP